MTERKQQNRERFPFAAAIVDDLRQVFGPGVKVSYARQGDLEAGTPLDMSSGKWISGADLCTAPAPKVKERR